MVLVLERRRVTVAETALAVLVQRIGADRAERQVDELVLGRLDREDVAARRAVAREREAGAVGLADLEEVAVAEAGGAQLVRARVHQGPRRDLAVRLGDIEKEIDV